MANSEFTKYTNLIHDNMTRRALKSLLDNIDDGTIDLTDVDLTQADIATLLLDGTTLSRTATEINSLLQYDTAQYKMASGSVNLDATEFGIATGLSSIVNVFTSIKSSSAPSNVVKVTWDATAGTLKLYGWKYTNTTTNTLVAASATASVKYTAIGAA